MQRVFITGTTRIQEDASMRGKSLEQVKNLLVAMGYAEVRTAEVKEKTEGDTQYIQFVPRAGRKG